ncbi:MAG: GNAT family acetyltransferase [Acidimicrobiales bacterium]
MEIRPFQETDRAGVIGLWELCDLLRPWNDPDRDIDRKLSVADDMFLVGTRSGRVIASVMAGFDGHRGWINYLGVHPEHQRRRVGGLMMTAAEERLAALGCPKVNLQIRHSNHCAVAFYEALGYRTDEVISMGKRLIADQ